MNYRFKELKDNLDYFYLKYSTKSFINSDPVQFVYKFDNERDREIAGFVASILSQGKRKNIISKCNELIIGIMKEPFDFVKNFDIDNIPKELYNFSYFAYRNIEAIHISVILSSLKKIISKYSSLKNIFYEKQKLHKGDSNVKNILIDFVDEFFDGKVSSEISSLVPSPRKGSACKRMNMFLRWMVRKDQVDSGLWSDIIPSSKLVIPLDFHVSKISRELGLTNRSQDDWITAEEITEKLKMFDPNDPVKYDFAIFGYGVNRGK
ncbi:MAG: TIGR02757 family protein [Brevinematia bacterium]